MARREDDYRVCGPSDGDDWESLQALEDNLSLFGGLSEFSTHRITDPLIHGSHHAPRPVPAPWGITLNAAEPPAE